MTKQESKAGLLLALGAYTLWGIFPIYWKLLAHIAPQEILAHRVIASAIMIALILGATKRLGEVRAALVDPKLRRALIASTFLIGINWFLYIWAVAGGHITEASLGYYINPLVNVLLARVVLGERLSRIGTVAVVLATIGVLILAIGLGKAPWISLGLAVTFGFYGLVRKQTAVMPLPGLAVESSLIAPIAFAYLVMTSRPLWHHTSRDIVLLIGSGAATTLPLALFANAARRLRFSTLGIIQYLSPSLQLLLAVAVYGEPFGWTHAVTFAFIWTAVALYVISLRTSR